MPCNKNNRAGGTMSAITLMVVTTVLLSSTTCQIDAFSISSSSSHHKAFTTTSTTISSTSSRRFLIKKNKSALFMSNDNDDSGNNEDEGSEEGSSLAAEFAAMARIRNIGLESQDYEDDDDYDDDDDEDDSTSNPQSDDDDDDEDDDDEEEMNIPEGAIEAFIDSDSAEGVSNKQVYDELRERVLDTAGGFVELVGGSADDDDDDDDYNDDDKEQEYKTPTTVPDSGLTAGEVVTTVLDALKHNDNPTPNRGVEVLFGYSSPTSQIIELQEADGLTPAEYANFLKEDSKEYRVLFEHSKVFIDKADYSFDKKRAFFTARLLKKEDSSEFTNVNFILSTNGQEEEDCWLIDSMLIRPEGMRRRRRR